MINLHNMIKQEFAVQQSTSIRHFVSVFSCGALGLLSLSCTSAEADGKAIYDKYCMSCHGADLKGNQAQSLVDGVWQYGSRDSNIFRSIKFGISAAGMPDYQGGLSDGEIRQVVEYIKSEEKDSGSATKQSSPDKIYARDYDVKVEPFIEKGIDDPWAMIFVDDTTAFVTEKSGGLRIIKNGELDPRGIEGLPKVYYRGQGGMLDVAIDPDYEENGWVYLSYSYESPQQNDHAMTRIVRGKIKDYQWTDQEVLWEVPADQPQLWNRSGVHYGCRIAFGPDGKLYFAHGERGAKDFAQDLDRPNGKIFRINRDGSIPDDNPFLDNKDALKGIWSYGHRNPQGLAFHPGTGQLWESEHGPMGGDEVNIIKPGLNYGWPEITYGINYNGTPITEHTRKPGMEQPIVYYAPSIAICGIDFVTGDEFPRWENNLLVTGLAFEEVRRLVIEDERVIHQELLLKNAGRVRDVCVGPDGVIYAVLNRPDKIVKLTNSGKALRQ